MSQTVHAYQYIKEGNTDYCTNETEISESQLNLYEE